MSAPSDRRSGWGRSSPAPAATHPGDRDDGERTRGSVRPSAGHPQPNTARLIRPAPAGRPAAGAAIITAFVWIVFAILGGQSGFLSVAGTLSYLDVAAQVGIIGTSVALLMIAGEFDLSIGSMVGFAGIVIGIGVTTFGHRSGWPSSSRWS